MEGPPQRRKSHEMATKKVSLVNVDEVYIDTHSQNKEFEFQIQKVSLRTRSPADELFFKGKLLPLNLLPRVQMIEKLLENDDSTSRNMSPSKSYKVSSCESLPSKYQFDWSFEIERLVSDHHHVPMKQTKQFSLAQRLKAPKTYMKSLFNTSGCSNKSCANDAATNKVRAVKKPNCKESQNKYMKDDARKNKNPFEFFCNNKHQRQRSCVVKNNDMLEDDFINSNKRSFSSVIQRHYTSKAAPLSTSSFGFSSLPSSFSPNSTGSYELQLFNKSTRVELENSINSAISHCKKSQQ